MCVILSLDWWVKPYMIFAFVNKFGNYAGMKTKKFRTGFDKYLILAESENELKYRLSVRYQNFSKAY